MDTTAKCICFIGPPASGKGTIASNIKEHFGIQIISPGEVFKHVRKQNAELGEIVREALKDGGYAPDSLTNDIVFHAIDELKQVCDAFNEKTIVMLDGFPRNIAQLESLEERYEICAFVHLDAPYEHLLKAAINRRNCVTCKKVFSAVNPPRRKGFTFYEIDRASDEITLLNDPTEAKNKENLAISFPKCNCLRGSVPDEGEQCASIDGEIAWETRWDDTAEFYEKRYDTYISITQPIIDAIRERPTYRRFEILTKPDDVEAVEKWLAAILGEY